MKEFVLSEWLARRLLYLPRFRNLEPAMNSALQQIAAAFPDFQMTAQPRPDGGYLVILRRQDDTEVRRVVTIGQLATDTQTEWLINAMRRDMALQFGEVPPVESLRMLRQSGLPTYNHA
jgi:hypothetical protein